MSKRPDKIHKVMGTWNHSLRVFERVACGLLKQSFEKEYLSRYWRDVTCQNCLIKQKDNPMTNKTASKAYVKYDEQYWAKRFDGDENPKVIKALKRIYNAYPVECMPQGTADPMYIINIIALELGIGDGQGNFNV